MVERPAARPGRRRIPRHPGRPLGHAVRYAVCPDRRADGDVIAAPLARPADAQAGRSLKPACRSPWRVALALHALEQMRVTAADRQLRLHIRQLYQGMAHQVAAAGAQAAHFYPLWTGDLPAISWALL